MPNPVPPTVSAFGRPSVGPGSRTVEIAFNRIRAGLGQALQGFGTGRVCLPAARFGTEDHAGQLQGKLRLAGRQRLVCALQDRVGSPRRLEEGPSKFLGST